MLKSPAPIVVLLALAAGLLAGCGTNPAGYDPYAANANGGSYDAGYGGTAGGYGDTSGSYGGTTGSYGDTSGSYGDTTGTYGGTTGTYGGSTGTYGGASGTYGGTATTGTQAGSYGDYGAGYGDDVVVGGAAAGRSGTNTTASPLIPSVAEPLVLSAWIQEVKETGVFGLGKIIAKVEVNNPTHRTLSGRLRVLFTDGGNPTANAFTRRVTLAPQETKVLTFTAEAWRLDDAEATIDTEPVGNQSGVVSDRPPVKVAP